MKFRCGRWRRIINEFIDRLDADKTEWHNWFAWHPVKVGVEDCRWLETVRRKKVYHRMSDGVVTVHYTSFHWRYSEC
jgi:hypothetical protein